MTTQAAGGLREKGRLSQNLAANLANFALNVLVGLLFTPYLIRHLGVASFGVIPLVTTATSYLTVFTLVLNASVGRFVTVELERGDHRAARRYFNTALFGTLALVLLLLVPSFVLTLNPALLFQIPAGEEQQARWFFGCSAAAFLLSVLSSAFEVSSFCRNRFELRNAAAMAGTLLRVGVVLLLFSLGEPRLWQVGAGVVAAALVSAAGAVAIWRSLTPELAISPRAADLGALKALSRSGGWVALNQAGTILLLGIDLLVVNRMFGPEACGRYAGVLQWSGLLRGAAVAVAAVSAPTILYHYARHDLDRLVSYCRSFVRYLGLALALPVGLVSGLSAPLLRLWLGPDFVELAPLLTLMTLPLCLNLCYLPLHNIAGAADQVRLPGVVQIALGLGNLALALLLAGPAGLGLFGVALAGAVVITLKNAVFTPLFSARLVGRAPATFYREALPVAAASLSVFALSLAAARLLPLASWGELAAASAGVALLYGAGAWFLLLDLRGREAVLHAVPLLRGSAR